MAQAEGQTLYNALMADSAGPVAQPTYSIIGADGNTYGPVDFATLKDWARDGRVLRNTIVIEHATGRQAAASEFAGLFDGVLPPTMGSASYEQAAEKKKTSPALIAAIILAGCCCLCIPVFAAILFPVFSQAKLAAKKTVSLSNVKQLSLGALMYCNDFDDKFPPHMETVASMRPYIFPYVKNEAIFVSPNPNGGEYLGNPKLSGKNSVKVVNPAKTIMIYDSQPWQPGNVALVGYADGHATSRDPFDKMLSDLQADPFK
jgi:hypothetical protein